MESIYHIPVLLDKSIELLSVKKDGIYVDLTFGGGGHSRKILSLLSEKGSLYSFDQDEDASQNIPDDPKFHFVASNFRFLRPALRFRGVEKVDGILADLGVSSHHFDTAERGFSIHGNGPLDMRMNRRGGQKACDIINTYDEEKLSKIFQEYGELETTWKIASCICRAREKEQIWTTEQLRKAAEPCTPKKDGHKFLTKLFQALRIEVNGEMEALKMALEQSCKMLKPGGRLVVISYHSLEDRLVKNFMKSGNFTGVADKDFFGNERTPFEIITKKAIVPDNTEVEQNSRSRSAKLRAAIKLL